MSAATTSGGAAARRPWKRRAIRIGAVLLGIAVAFRLLLMVLLPVVMSRVARVYGLDCRYDRLKLSILGTNASLWGLVLTSRDGKQEVLRTDYANANLSTLRLFRLQLLLWRLEADGVNIELERLADGSMPVVAQLAAAMQPAPVPSRATKARAVDFSSPLVVKALRLHGCEVHFTDRTSEPPFEETIRTDVAVSDVGVPGAPVRVAIDVTSGGLFSLARLEGSAAVARDSLDADLSFSLRGLQAARAGKYLALVGLEADDRAIDMSGRAALRLVPAATTPGALEGTATVRDISVRAASASVASLATLGIGIAALSPSDLHLSDVRVEGGSIRAERTPEGRLQFAAFSPGARPATPASPIVAAPVSAAAGATMPFRWRVDRVTGSGLTAWFQDRAAYPENTVSVELTDLRAEGLASEGAPEAGPTFNATLTSPRMVGLIRVDGRATPFAPEPSAQVRVDVESIRPDALLPYLRAMGVEPVLEAASVRLTMSAGLTGSPLRGGFTLDHVVVEDRGTPLVQVGPVTIAGVAIGPAGELEIGSLEGQGPEFRVRRLADGRFEGLGLRVGGKPVALERASPGASAPAGATTPRLRLPPLKIGRFAWTPVRVRFEDAGLPDATPIELTDAGVEITNLNLATVSSEPGSVRLWATAPGLIDRIEATGALTSGPGALGADLAVRGSGVDLSRLAPYLKAVSVEPTLQNGVLAAHLTASVAETEEGVRLSVAATDTSLSQGGATLAGLARAAVERVDLTAGRVAIGPVIVDGLELAASRNEEGGVSCAGVTVVPGVSRAASGMPLDPFGALAALGDTSIEGVRLCGLSLTWSDAATRTPVATRARVEATLGMLALNNPAAVPAAFDMHLSAEGMAEEVAVAGTLSAGGDGVRVEARVTARGLSAAVPAAYLPEGVSSALANGQFSMGAAASLARAEQGGFSGGVSVRDLDYREGDTALAHIASFGLDVERANPATGDLVVKRVAGEGITLEARRRADGALSVLGLAIAPVPDAAPRATAPPPQEGAVDLAAIVHGSQRPPPLIAVEEMDVGIERVGFTDEARPGAAPAALTGMRIRAASPIRLLGPKPEECPPAKVEIQGRVEPVVGAFEVSAEAALFAASPSFGVGIHARGIDGSALTRVAPEIAGLLDGAKLTDGRFKAAISGEPRFRRRGGAQIDLSRGLELGLSIEGVEFRDGEAGPVLAGVGRIRADQVRIDTAGNVVAREVEVEQVVGNAWRDGDGVHVLGMIIRPLSGPEGAEPAAAAEPGTPPEPAAAPAAPASSAKPTISAGPEIRIDRLTASGLDYRFEDREVLPPVQIPFSSLEAEIRGLSSALLTQDRPVRFNVSVGAGKVSLPKPVRGGTLTGALSDLFGGGAAVAQEVEERDFFSQCIASGTMSFYPAPRGRAIASINGVELSAVRGLAQAAGASLGGGLFDGRVDLLARDDGAVEARTRLVVTDLRYAEPASGPVERYMSLPVPIDAAIKAVEAPDGSITIPVDVTLDQRGLTTGKLIAAIVGAAGQVVATAVVSAPVKVVTGFAGLFGESAEATWVEEDPVYLEYPNGVTALPPEALERVRRAIGRAGSSKRVQVSFEHQLGERDTTLMWQRANPAKADAGALADDLRRRRGELLSRRAELLPAASAAVLGLGPSHAREGLAALQEELAALEDSMDRLYDLRRPGAEGQASRRARAAAVELVDARMAAVRRLVGAGSGSSRIAVGGARVEPSGVERSRLVIRVRRRE